MLPVFSFYSRLYMFYFSQYIRLSSLGFFQIVVQKDSPRGTHFRRAGPREEVPGSKNYCLLYMRLTNADRCSSFDRFQVYFTSEEVRACIVTCGGLCPGINTVIREIVCGLNYMYGVDDILGIEVNLVLTALTLSFRFYELFSLGMETLEGKSYVITISGLTGHFHRNYINRSTIHCYVEFFCVVPILFS